MNINFADIEHRIHRDLGRPLDSVARLLEVVLGPLSLGTPEERAFSLAVEIEDIPVAGATMERVIARHQHVLPLSVRALWFGVASSLRNGDICRSKSQLFQILDYLR